MYNLKTFFVAIIITATTLLANANTQFKNENGSLDYTIEAYLEMVNLGNVKNYASVLADDVKFNTTRNGKLISHGKTEELNHIRRVGIIKQNCKTECQTINSDDSFCVIKVKMIYENFTKENFISLSKTENGWKITNVTSVF